MRKQRYPQVYEGDWIAPSGTWRQYGHRLRCCDCCLVHRFDFRIRKGHVEFRAYRLDRATAASRRGKDNKQKLKRLAR